MEQTGSNPCHVLLEMSFLEGKTRLFLKEFSYAGMIHSHFNQGFDSTDSNFAADRTCQLPWIYKEGFYTRMTSLKISGATRKE